MTNRLDKVFVDKVFIIVSRTTKPCVLCNAGKRKWGTKFVPLTEDYDLSKNELTCIFSEREKAQKWIDRVLAKQPFLANLKMQVEEWWQ